MRVFEVFFVLPFLFVIAIDVVVIELFIVGQRRWWLRWWWSDRIGGRLA